MAKVWYYQVKGSILGPVGSSELLKLAQSGTVLPASLIRTGEDGQWVQASRIQRLFDPKVHIADGAPNSTNPALHQPLGDGGTTLKPRVAPQVVVVESISPARSSGIQSGLPPRRLLSSAQVVIVCIFALIGIFVWRLTGTPRDTSVTSLRSKAEAEDHNSPPPSVPKGLASGGGSQILVAAKEAFASALANAADAELGAVQLSVKLVGIVSDRNYLIELGGGQQAVFRTTLTEYTTTGRAAIWVTRESVAAANDQRAGNVGGRQLFIEANPPTDEAQRAANLAEQRSHAQRELCAALLVVGKIQPATSKEFLALLSQSNTSDSDRVAESVLRSCNGLKTSDICVRLAGISIDLLEEFMGVVGVPEYARSTNPALLLDVVGCCVSRQEDIPRVMNLFSKHGLGAKDRDSGSRTILQQAFATKDPSLCEARIKAAYKLIVAGADAKAIDDAGDTLLHYAMRASARQVDIKPLLAAGLSIDAKNTAGMTPLMAVAEAGGDGWHQLLENNAQLEVRGPGGRTALHYAAASGKKESYDLINQLIERGSQPFVRDDAGKRAAAYAKHQDERLLNGVYKKLLIQKIPVPAEFDKAWQYSGLLYGTEPIIAPNGVVWSIRGGAATTTVGAFRLGDTVSKQWQLEGEPSFGSVPTPEGDLLMGCIEAGERKSIVRLDPVKGVLWTWPIPKAEPSDGVVMVSGPNRTTFVAEKSRWEPRSMSMLDATGHTIWHATAMVTAACVGSDGSSLIMTTGSQPTVQKRSPTGELSWTFVPDGPEWGNVSDGVFTGASTGKDGSMFIVFIEKRREGSLFSLGKDGKLKWRKSIGYRQNNAPTVASADSIITFGGDEIQCFGTSGERKWHSKSHGPPMGRALLSPSGYLYYRGGTKCIRVDVTTGKEQEFGEWDTIGCFTDTDLVVFTTKGNELVWFDCENIH